MGLDRHKLSPLKERHTKLSKHFFLNIKDDIHIDNIDMIYHLLPAPKNREHNVRDNKKYSIPSTRTNRYKNSFVPYCLFNFQMQNQAFQTFHIMYKLNYKYQPLNFRDISIIIVFDISKSIFHFSIKNAWFSIYVYLSIHYLTCKVTMYE